MKIAVPTSGGRLAAHFGHCEQFALFEIDGDPPAAVGSEALTAPAHAPGLLPQWLNEQGADVIIAGGMGRRAQNLFAQSGIDVVVGAPSEQPERVVELYLAGELETGDNICDH